jgi:hypothetical protein
MDVQMRVSQFFQATSRHRKHAEKPGHYTQRLHVPEHEEGPKVQNPINVIQSAPRDRACARTVLALYVKAWKEPMPCAGLVSRSLCPEPRSLTY